MRARIFYFTGTGNSPIAAKMIAEKIGGQTDPIVKYKKQQSVSVKEDIIGVVFPVYLAQIYGIPEVVKHFLEKLDYDKNKYYFVVCTYGGYAYPNAFPTLDKCNKLVRSCGGNVDGRFYVRFPLNNLDYDHIPIPIQRDTNVILKKATSVQNNIKEKV